MAWRCPTCYGSATKVRSSDASQGRSVILFWLSGGPGHMETWDPKPNAPSGFRGPFGAIRTNVARRPVRRTLARAGATDG